MSRDRSVQDKVADWMTAFEAIKAELTPAPLRVMMRQLTEAVPPEGTDDLDQVKAYVERVNVATALSRLIFTNDRAASVTAAMLTQSGVSRPQLDVIDGGAE